MTTTRWAAYAVLVLLTACGEATGPQTVGDDGSAAPSPPSSPPDTTATDPPAPAEVTLPPFTPAGGVTWLTVIPGGLPLAAGLPRADGDFTVQRIAAEADSQVLELCGEMRLDEAGIAIDGWRVSGPELAEVRQLRLHESDQAARRALESVVERVRTCRRESNDGGATLIEPRTSRVDAEGLTVVVTYEWDGETTLGAVFVELVRVGNAVLLTLTGGEYLPGPTLDQAIARHADEYVAPIVTTMCVFAAEPCGASPLASAAAR